MAEQKRYPPEVRAKALELYVTLGAAETARRMGMPRQTVRKWAINAGVETMVESCTRKATDQARLTRQQKRETLRERLLDTALFFVEDAPRCEPRDRQSTMVAAGIAVDKLRLELGESTSRTETHSTIAHLDAELQQWVSTVRSDTPGTPSPIEAQARELPGEPRSLAGEVTDRGLKEGGPCG